ncbi:MAG: NAD(P)/FAD-dependent oxidoreductase [Deferrisomatales bacterium]|nr:NAD(P)/FAD-dependent oxidoreductase [Deferrisomatales bacterium]
MDTCDVLVVGGGPAGSSCAATLCAAGLDVLVLDRALFPRPKTCAGWVTPQLFETLGLTPENYGQGRVLQPITGFRLGLWGGRRTEVRYGGPVSYGILRAELDDFLLRRSGARLRLGEPLAALERRGGRWLANGEVAARWLVGAGGPRCPVARRLGARGGTAVAALEVEIPLDGRPCPVSGDTPELWFTPDLKGYGWCFRKGDHLNVGLGVEGGGALKPRAAAFLASVWEPLAPRERPPLSGWAYRLWGHGPSRLVWDGTLLVGDAAGLAYPESGEGIRPAVESGVLAARAILDDPGDPRAERLHSYEQALRRRLGPPRAPAGPPSTLRRLAGRVLLGSRPFLRRIVLDRWFLRRADPPLRPAAALVGPG